MFITKPKTPEKDEFGPETHNPAYQSKGVFPSKQGGTGFLNSNRTKLYRTSSNDYYCS